MRAGAYGLSLLSDPLDVQVLKSLESGPLPLIDLRRAVGSPPQTTLRKHLKALTGLGVLVRTRQRQFPAAVTFELSPSGLELLGAATSLSTWLAAAPDGSLSLGDPAAKSAIKALVDAWTTKMLRALAAKPLSLTELDRLLAGVNYPALERRLGALRLAGLVEPAPARSGHSPYRVTRWLREAVGPLVAGASWEREQTPGASKALGRLDVEAIFLLAVPLLQLPTTVDGSCRLAVDVSNGRQEALAGAVVTVDQGRPVACSSDLTDPASGTVEGPADAWLKALRSEDENGIEVDGDHALVDALMAGLRRVVLFRGDGRLVAA